MAVANTLAYYDTATITTVKGFMTQRPWSKFKLSLLYSNARLLALPANIN
jgi:hypothetical protein